MAKTHARQPGTVQGAAARVASTTAWNGIFLNRKKSSAAVTSQAAARPRCLRIGDGSGSRGGSVRRGGGRVGNAGGRGGRRRRHGRELDGDVDGAARAHV